MFRRQNLIGLVVVAICLFRQDIFGAEDLNSRIIRETKALFDMAIGDKSNLFEPPGARCRFDTQWPKASGGELPTNIPDALARQQLGLREGAPLVHPSVTPSLQEFLDPEAEHPLAFCSDETRRNYMEEHRRNVESGEEEDYWTLHDTYSFPLFDKEFRKAIIIVTHSSGVFHNRSGGWPGSINCAAQVYAKSEGVWRLVKSVELCMT